ncbi:murein biosynthesis integral membrane protein MurJ [Bacillus salipaludis]|uniref:Murein biosynthesis integral membrane protein MurJ n=1 Tax=Bacillus salipaludis TaxID=2547811 RepID=A0AA90QX05_9BACI|nr:murein biosynthesis integral membrane protein MurJ [Bacillus salipaludis]MDQ6595010.1 murein biosynthesis integral membrane protein MurJ [Bacillus salipaludis]
MAKTSTKRSTILIAILTLFSAVLGFGRESYTAYLFGASSLTDVYFVAGMVPDVIAGWIGYTLTRAIVPSIKKEINNKGSSAKLISATFYITLITSIVLSIITFFSKKEILSTLASNFNEVQYSVGSNMLGIMVIAIVFSSLSGVLWGIHNAYEEFSYPALTGVLYNLLFLITLVLLQRWFGIYSLAIGLVAGGIGKFIIQFVPLFKKKILNLRFRVWHTEMPLVFQSMIPIFLSQLVGQINQVVDRIVASGLPQGQLSDLNFASKLGMLPISLIGSSIATTIYSRFVTHTLEKDEVELKRLISLGLGWMCFFGIVIFSGLFFYKNTLISIFYYHGKFAINDVFLSAKPMAVYGIFSTAYLFVPILIHFFYARNEGKFVLISSAIAVGFYVFTSSTFVEYLGIIGLALANGLSQLIYVTIMYSTMIKRLNWSFRSSIKSILNIGFPSGIAFLIGVVIVCMTWKEPELGNKLTITIRGALGLFAGCLSVLIYSKLNPNNPTCTFVLNFISKIQTLTRRVLSKLKSKLLGYGS